MKKFALGVNKLWKATSMIAGVFLVFNMLLIIANIIMRRFFNAPIFGSTEIVSYASFITASLALAQNEWFNGNIQMTLIVDSIPKRASKFLVFLDNLICSAAFVFICTLLYRATITKFEKGNYTQDLHLPFYIFQGVLTFGFVLLTICVIIKTVISAYNAITNSDIPTAIRERVE